MVLAEKGKSRLSAKCLTKDTFFAPPGTCGKIEIVYCESPLATGLSKA